MESVVIGTIANILDSSVRQQDVVLPLRYSIVVLVLGVSKIVARVKVSDAVPESVARLFLLLTQWELREHKDGMSYSIINMIVKSIYWRSSVSMEIIAKGVQ